MAVGGGPRRQSRVLRTQMKDLIVRGGKYALLEFMDPIGTPQLIEGPMVYFTLFRMSIVDNEQ